MLCLQWILIIVHSRWVIGLSHITHSNKLNPSHIAHRNDPQSHRTQQWPSVTSHTAMTLSHIAHSNDPQSHHTQQWPSVTLHTAMTLSHIAHSNDPQLHCTQQQIKPQSHCTQQWPSVTLHTAMTLSHITHSNDRQSSQTAVIMYRSHSLYMLQLEHQSHHIITLWKSQSPSINSPIHSLHIGLLHW